MAKDFDLKSIYKKIDRQIVIERILEKGFFWIVGIILILSWLGVLFGYIDLPGRCYYDERWDDYICRDY